MYGRRGNISWTTNNTRNLDLTTQQIFFERSFFFLEKFTVFRSLNKHTGVPSICTCLFNNKDSGYWDEKKNNIHIDVDRKVIERSIRLKNEKLLLISNLYVDELYIYWFIPRVSNNGHSLRLHRILVSQLL